MDDLDDLDALLDSAVSCKCADGGPADWNPQCPIHKVGHVFVDNERCCDSPEEEHRHMDKAEYDARFPILYDKTQTAPSGEKYHVQARRFPNGVGVSLTLLLDENGGLCFDLGGQDSALVGQMLIEAGSPDIAAEIFG